MRRQQGVEQVIMKLPKSYEPKEYEESIYALWERSGAFEPKKRGNDDHFSVVVPPPNANANLHIGFGLTMAIEDTVVRYQRMQGKATLFVPGADHAGFESQVVYEKQLAKEGKSRFDFSREELYKLIWDFVAGNRSNFEKQFRALGASVDWPHFTFTLDDKIVDRVYETFHQMWQDGLIYRGERIVNYCTFHGTSFSDIEVVHEEEETMLWHIAYPLANGNGELVIATTRPETKLGQAALMVHPDDERYKQFIGQHVLQPLVPDTPIEVIADEHVDMNFGTGVVTVTPGHDTNDFAVAQRHQLTITKLITTEGKMSDNVPEPFRGLTVMEAREAVADALKQGGYLRGAESHVHSVGKCYKCATTIEPLVLDQWFVDMQPLAQKAIKALEKGEITFYPDSKRQQLIKYLEGLHDWNISRQIAWGIPIPAFQNVDDPEDWIFDRQVASETIKLKGRVYKRDPDVFDTWFSSGSWPYSTIDYPDGKDFKQFYPLSLMETGGDILYPWVSRMIMLGLYTTGEVPFKDVYIHGYVRAEDGTKMSKSLGNTIELTDIIDQYGADAMRMGILAGRVAAINRSYDPRRVIEARNFCNKLWNIARFTEDKLLGQQALRLDPKPESLADHWILGKLNDCIKTIDQEMASYRLGEAYEVLYHFIWDDLADWYIEASKTNTNPSVLAYVLEAGLKLTHPFAPFVTETIWQTLAWEKNSILAVQQWPREVKFNQQAADDFATVQTVVSECRHIITELNVKKPILYYTGVEFLTTNAVLIASLAGLDSVMELKAGNGLHLTKAPFDCWLNIDKDTAEHYVGKLEAEQRKQEAAVRRLEVRLANKEYVDKAPAEMVQQTKDQLATETELLASLDAKIKGFLSATRHI